MPFLLISIFRNEPWLEIPPASLLALNLILSLNLFSQAAEDILLNEEFLDSLPEETKADLVEQLEKDADKLEEVDYGIFNSMWSKSSAERFIDQELLRTEIDVAPEDITLDDLEIFGKNFFTGYPSTFSPVSEPSLSYTYILDLGDKINVEIFGAHKFSGISIISTDGSIVVSGIGSIQIAGLSLEMQQKRFLMQSHLNIQVLKQVLNWTVCVTCKSL